MSSSATLGLYDQWRKNHSFAYEWSKKGEFRKRLLAGEVDSFDLTQDCNMAGEYTRCFYTLVGKATVYQETPISTPYIRWKRIEGVLKRLYQQEDKDTWTYIKDNYDRTSKDFQVQCKRKAAIEEECH
jgi:hypothetical protein